MYLLAEHTVTLACSRQRAFDYIANLENFGQWFPGVIAIAAENTLPFASVGKQYRETVAMPGRGRRTVHIRVIEAAAPVRLVTEGTLAVLLPRMEMVFDEPAAGTCRLTWRMHSRNTGLLPRWTLLPLARRTMSRRAAIGLRRLGHLLDRPAAG